MELLKEVKRELVVKTEGKIEMGMENLFLQDILDNLLSRVADMGIEEGEGRVDN